MSFGANRDMDEDVISMTSVCREEFKAGRIAAEMIMSMIHEKRTTAQDKVHKGELVTRQSSGPPRDRERIIER